MTRRDWDNTESRAIGVFLNGEELDVETERGEKLRDDSFLLLFNTHFEDIPFRLPARRFGSRWEVVLSTGRCEGHRLVPGSEVAVQSRSVAVLRRQA
jgi:glycogen operon protein